MVYVFMFWVQCCDVCYDFLIKTMFDSFLPQVVCRRLHVLFTLFVFVCVSGAQHILCCVFFCLSSSCVPMLPVSLDCQFLRVSEWLLFYANSAILQLYHGENKLIFNEMMMRFALYSTNMVSCIFIVLLKQQSAGTHVTPLGHIILIPSQPFFALSP